MSELTMVSFCTLIFHEFLAYLDIVTEIALVSIRTASQVLEFVARLDFTSVMLVRTSLSTFTMNELLANTIFGQFMGIRGDGLILIEVTCVVKAIVAPGTLAVVIKILHLMI